jgi:hypothetical protein
MASVNTTNIKQTLHITSDIYNIIMKNQVLISNYNRQNLNSTYRKALPKNKNFEDVIKQNMRNIKKMQFFCSNFCGGNIDECTCMHRVV